MRFPHFLKVACCPRVSDVILVGWIGMLRCWMGSLSYVLDEISTKMSRRPADVGQSGLWPGAEYHLYGLRSECSWLIYRLSFSACRMVTPVSFVYGNSVDGTNFVQLEDMECDFQPFNLTFQVHCFSSNNWQPSCLWRHFLYVLVFFFWWHHIPTPFYSGFTKFTNLSSWNISSFLFLTLLVFCVFVSSFFFSIRENSFQLPYYWSIFSWAKCVMKRYVWHNTIPVWNRPCDLKQIRRMPPFPPSLTFPLLLPVLALLVTNADEYWKEKNRSTVPRASSGNG